MADPKQTNAQQDKAAEIIKEFERLSSDRGSFEGQWQEIAERIFPAQSGLFNANNIRTPGEKRTELVFDATGTIALGRFGAIIDSLLTPANRAWHNIKPSDALLLKNRETRIWFEETNATLLRQRRAPKANFSSQNQQNYLALGAFGTGAVFIDALQSDPGVRYRAIHLGEIFIDENHQGIVDRALRHFRMTARQATQKWGADKLPDRINGAMATNPDQKFWFIHCVKPRDDRDPGRADYRGMAMASYYVAKEDRLIVAESGYRSFPYAISRYTQAPGEVYGRSPAMDVLPAIKTLNEEKKTILKQGHRTVDPVLLAHDDGVLDGFSLRPGAINAGGVNAEGRALVQPLPVGNIAIGKELMDDERVAINDAFLVTLFQILVETPTMTATEVLERTREKGILLAPTIGRQQSEYLGPLIERELDLLAQQGLLAPMPQALVEAKGEYRIEYDSPLSRATRAEEAAGVMRTVEQVLAVVNITQNPAPLDHFDWDTIVPEMAEINATPARWMRSLADVQKIREGREQQQQTQTAIQAAPGAAALIKSTAVASQGKAA